jgi:excisionase family DNA binding protein
MAARYSPYSSQAASSMVATSPVLGGPSSENRIRAVVKEETAALWRENAELREMVEELSYRLEALTAVEPDADRLWTLSEVAERLQLSRSTIYRERRAGRLKTEVIGGCVRISESAVQEYLQAEMFGGVLVN